jgi:hypothetical protein
MFPEFIDLAENPWNSVHLSARQHIIAHILLWKTYQNMSQTAAVHYMINVQNEDTIWFSLRKIPTSIQIRYSATAKEAFYKNRAGFATWKDSEGNKYFLHVDDPRIQELNLVGNNTGYQMGDESKEKMAVAKLVNRKVMMTFLDLTRRVQLFSAEYDAHLAQGWKPIQPRFNGIPRMYEEDILYRRSKANAQKSIETKGTANYWYSDGTPFGERLSHDDPRIEELGLVIITTDAKRDAARRNSKLANQANLGTTWYNNGIINKKFKEHPGGDWKVGQIVDHTKIKNRGRKCSEKVAGTKTYNDGVRNYRIKDGDYIDPSWKPGMAPQKHRKPSQLPGGKVYNDGVKTIRVYPGDYIDPTWNVGMIKSNTPRKIRYTNGIDIITVISGNSVPDGYRKATKEEIDNLS